MKFPYQGENGKPEYKIVALARGRGGYLGEGKFADVKCGVDRDRRVYAVKIEATNTLEQINEHLIFDDMGKSHGEKIIRKTQSQKQHSRDKFYTLLDYLGTPLTAQ